MHSSINIHGMLTICLAPCLRAVGDTRVESLVCGSHCEDSYLLFWLTTGYIKYYKNISFSLRFMVHHTAMPIAILVSIL